MKPLKKAVRPKLDEVDRAVVGVQKAIDKLVTFLCHGDRDVVLKVGGILRFMGSFGRHRCQKRPLG
jgi:hypothetical protein